MLATVMVRKLWLLSHPSNEAQLPSFSPGVITGDPDNPINLPLSALFPLHACLFVDLICCNAFLIVENRNIISVVYGWSLWNCLCSCFSVSCMACDLVYQKSMVPNCLPQLPFKKNAVIVPLRIGATLISTVRWYSYEMALQGSTRFVLTAKRSLGSPWHLGRGQKSAAIPKLSLLYILFPIYLWEHMCLGSNEDCCGVLNQG